MKPSWVLTEQEKHDKRATKRDTKELKQNVSDDTPKNIVQESISFLKGPVPTYRSLANQVLEELLFAQEILILTAERPSDQIAQVIAKCARKNVSDPIENFFPRWASLEFFKAQYGHAAKFAMYVDEFSALTSQSQRILLNYNMEALTSIRLAINFRSADKMRYDDAASLSSQLKEIGLEDDIVNSCGISTSEHLPLTIEQIFTQDWACDLEHYTLYHKVIANLNELVGNDVKLALLLSMSNLFNATDIGSDLEPVQRKTIERIQLRWTLFLQNYIQVKFGSVVACKIFPRFLLISHDLRLLSEKNSKDRNN